LINANISFTLKIFKFTCSYCCSFPNLLLLLIWKRMIIIDRNQKFKLWLVRPTSKFCVHELYSTFINTSFPVGCSCYYRSYWLLHTLKKVNLPNQKISVRLDWIRSLILIPSDWFSISLYKYLQYIVILVLISCI